jgi:hypothetical protein
MIIFRWFSRFFTTIIPTVLAVSLGLITLLAFLLPDVTILGGLRAVFVSWAAVLAAFALLAGFFNVLGVHMGRIGGQRHGWPYSIALLLGVLTVLVAAGFDAINAQGDLDPAGPMTSWLFANVIVQMEIAVAALIPFFLAFAAYRALRHATGQPAESGRTVWGTLLFLFGAWVVLLRSVTLVTDETIAGVQNVITRLVDAAALGGARGLLIGVALGIIATGLRVLVGLDRPHSE